MQVRIPYATTDVAIEIPIERVRMLKRLGPLLPAIDSAPALAAALESPTRYPALRLALTPDDHLTVIVDERLPHVAGLVTAILDHVTSAGVAPDAVTLLCPPSRSTQPWIDELPERFEDVHIEMHDPVGREHLAYLATTRVGRRVYLNRAVVEADQIVVLCGMQYDSLHGYAGPGSLVYPALSDVETRHEWKKTLTNAAPVDESWPAHREAEEVLWLLGAPFLVQVVRGTGESIVQIVAGSADALPDGRAALDAMWRAQVDGPSDIVVAGIGGDISTISIDDIAQALASAARVVADGGTIVLLSGASPAVGDGLTRAQEFDEPQAALKALQKEPPVDFAPAWHWLRTCSKARVILYSGWTDDQAESLFVTPMTDPRQLQRVVDAGGDCLVLPDAHRMMVTLDAGD